METFLLIVAAVKYQAYWKLGLSNPLEAMKDPKLKKAMCKTVYIMLNEEIVNNKYKTK